MQQPEDEKAGNSKSGTQDGVGADDVYDFDGDPDDPNAFVAQVNFIFCCGSHR